MTDHVYAALGSVGLETYTDLFPLKKKFGGCGSLKKISSSSQISVISDITNATVPTGE